MTLGMFFTGFTDFEKFKEMVSLDSKHGVLKRFYKFLSNFENHKPTNNIKKP